MINNIMVSSLNIYALSQVLDQCIEQRYKLLFFVRCSGKFPIITFEEFIDIALDAPRIVGIYPEIKNPVFINQHVSI